MKAKVDILTTPTADTPGTCLMIEFDDKKYLVGHVHEGCQRAILERGKRMIKITDVFLTGRVEWANTGGLLGLVITSADSKTAALQAARDLSEEKQKRRVAVLQKQIAETKPETPKWSRLKTDLEEELKRQEDEGKEKKVMPGKEGMPMGIHGGRNLKHTVATCRRFLFRQGMPLRVFETHTAMHNGSLKPSWSDSNLEVFSIPVLPQNVTDDVKSSAAEQQVLDAIVHDMFESGWSMDALFESRLADVQMPAAIFIRDPVSHKLEKYNGPRPGDKVEEPLPDINVLVRKPWPAATVKQLPQTSPSSATMSYIMRCHPQRGKFLPDEAKRLGVPVNKFKELAAGKALTLEDGTEVAPEQVMEPSRTGAAFAVIDIPSASYVKATLDRPEWTMPGVNESLRAIFWILGPGVSDETLITNFIKQRPSLEHIISAPDSSPNYLSLSSAASIQVRLASINDENHPILEFSTKSEELNPGLESCHLAYPGRTFHLEPKSKWDTAEEVKHLNSAKVLEEIPLTIKQMAANAKREVLEVDFQAQLAAQKLPGQDAEIITLGTGSAAPSKYRNVSGTLLRVPGYGSYLFDAGENTLGQLSRIFKPEELQSIFRDLRMIWISHLHADHHLGTTSIIKAWHQANHASTEAEIKSFHTPDFKELAQNPSAFLNQTKLFVVSDDKMIKWLAEYSAAENFGFDKVVPISTRGAESGDPSSTSLRWGNIALEFDSRNGHVAEALRKATGLVDIQTAYVEHCSGAQAVSITFSDGFKVSYSGDCRPSKRFVEIGQGSTLLIHEATFNDELQGDALAKKHSTISEAIKVGMEMGAPRVMLTHFSQRYAKVSTTDNIKNFNVKFEEASGDQDVEGIADRAGAGAADKVKNTNGQATNGEALQHASLQDLKVGVAFDYMRVKVRDIAKLEKYIPTINAMLEDEHPEEKAEEPDDKKKKGAGSSKRKRGEVKAD